jgi:hypothetical protein
MLETNFKPRKTLKKIAEQYITHHEYKPLQQGNPFFLKGLFPGSHRKLDPIDKEHIILQYSPSDFDYIKRGDCMLLAGRHYVKIAKIITTAAVMLYFGLEGLNYANPGWKLWEPENSPLINSYTLQ